MKKIEFSTKIDNKRQAVFIILYALDGMPWKTYQDNNQARKELVIPVCLMINRADGTLGFIGGKVEKGESLEDAVKREANEEIGYQIQNKLEKIVAHDIGPITTYAFALELTYQELRDIQKNAIQADHSGSEICGVLLPHLINYDEILGTGGGIVNLIASSMAPSVREELIQFLLSKKIFSKDSLTDICNKAGYTFENILR